MIESLQGLLDLLEHAQPLTLKDFAPPAHVLAFLQGEGKRGKSEFWV